MSGGDARKSFARISAVVGEHLGEYELLDKLGEGGMGEVFLARHARRDTHVAIKILKASLSADDKLVQRFWGEAKAAASIQHPAIAQVLDVGRTESGSAFLVMEYLKGETLRHRLRREGPMQERQAVGFAKQLASVLSAAHAKGIVHRDIKPENIFIVVAPEIVGGERIKLLDFGVAKLMDPQAGMNLTQTGDVIGTPMYMSPEQCRGTGQYDARTDLYSLGCVMFEMICGRPPFVSKFPGDIMAAHIGTPPPLASKLRQVSKPLEGLLKKLLEKGPDNRISDANALLVILESLYDEDATVLDAAPMMTRGMTTLQAATIRPGKQSRRRPLSEQVQPQETTLTSAAGSAGEVPATPRNLRSLFYTIGASLAVAAAIVVAFASGGSIDAEDSTTSHPAAAPTTIDDITRPTTEPTPAVANPPARATQDAKLTAAPVEAEPGPGDEPAKAQGKDEVGDAKKAPGIATTDDKTKAPGPEAGKDEASKTVAAKKVPDTKARRRNRTRRKPLNTKRAKQVVPPKKKTLTGNEAVNPFD